MIFLLLGLGTVISAVASLLIGAGDVGLAGYLELLNGTADSETQIVIGMRVTRTLGGIAVGAALAIAGSVLQIVTRNPLADPGILGVNAASGLAVLIGYNIFALTSATAIGIFAAIGAGLGVLLLSALNLRHQGNPVTLTLSGIAIAAVISTLSTFILLTNPDNLTVYKNWSLGNLEGLSSDRLIVGGLMVLIGTGIATALIQGLKVLELGTTQAGSLGLSVTKFFIPVGAAVALTAGGASAIAGPIIFVGLAAPHIARLLVGHSVGRLLLGSALVGPVLVLLSDTLARILHESSELPLSVVLALFGAPVLLLLLGRVGWAK